MIPDAAPIPEDAVQAATVGRPHGVRGEMRLFPESGRPERLREVSVFWLRSTDGERVGRFVVNKSRLHSGALLAQLEGIEDRDVAASWTNAEAWALDAELPEWEVDEFGVDEVVGYELFDEKTRVGVVTGVATNAGLDYFEVEHAGRSVLVPAAKDWLIERSTEARRIVMRLPPGLLDEM